MAPMFVREGWDVVGLDAGYFADCTLVPDPLPIPEIKADIRDISSADLEGFDAVVHLAALSNDPLGDLSPDWTRSINTAAAVRLAGLASAAGVPRFLFSSSCIMYGLSDAPVVDENAPLAPQTPYAASKVEAERAIAGLAGPDFAPVFLRNGTVYGISPRMRFDTVFNSLMGSAIATGRVIVLSDGEPWRPVVHVEDVCAAFAAVLRAPLGLVRGEAFNVGADQLNHQVRELAHAVSAATGAAVELRAQPDADQRSYWTSFAKFKRAFPDFTPRWSIHTAATSMRDTLRSIGLDEATFRDPRFTRLRWLTRLLDDGQLGRDDLRWPVGAAAAR